MKLNYVHKVCSFCYRELKDNITGDVTESDASELLKAILAREPSVFKGGTSGGK